MPALTVVRGLDAEASWSTFSAVASAFCLNVGLPEALPSSRRVLASEDMAVVPGFKSSDFFEPLYFLTASFHLRFAASISELVVVQAERSAIVWPGFVDAVDEDDVGDVDDDDVEVCGTDEGLVASLTLGAELDFESWALPQAARGRARAAAATRVRSRLWRCVTRVLSSATRHYRDISPAVPANAAICPANQSAASYIGTCPTSGASTYCQFG